jgi:hypothetical protein
MQDFVGQVLQVRRGHERMFPDHGVEPARPRPEFDLLLRIGQAGRNLVDRQIVKRPRWRVASIADTEQPQFDLAQSRPETSSEHAALKHRRSPNRRQTSPWPPRDAGRPQRLPLLKRARDQSAAGNSPSQASDSSESSRYWPFRNKPKDWTRSWGVARHGHFDRRWHAKRAPLRISAPGLPAEFSSPRPPATPRPSVLSCGPGRGNASGMCDKDYDTDII